MLGEAGVKHIKVSLSPSLDLHQYAYRQNRSTDDAISSALHGALGHVEHRDSCVRMPFIAVHCRSAFNTLVPHILHNKPLTWASLHLPTLGSLTSSQTANRQLDLVLTSPPPPRSARALRKSTAVLLVHLRLCTDSDAYRDEIQQLTEWCLVNSLSLNTTKTKEMILNFRRKQGAEPAPIFINGDCVKRVHTFKFLGSLISEDLTWTANTVH